MRQKIRARHEAGPGTRNHALAQCQRRLELPEEFDELFELELLDEFEELFEDEFDELLDEEFELEFELEFEEEFELELLDCASWPAKPVTCA